MIVRAEGGRAILTTHEIPDMVIGEGFPKALPEKLHMTLLQTERLHRLSGLRIRIPVTRDVLLIVSVGDEVSRIMIFQLHHTAIRPFARAGYTATFTLAAGNLNPIEPGLFCIGGNLRDIRSTNAAFTKLQMMNAIGNYLHIGLAIVGKTNLKTLKGMKT
jgi:hypothetical protein